jgi:hypothetical protein
MNAGILVGLVGIVLFASACRPSQGAVSPTGYAPDNCGYEVRFEDADRQSLMSPEWRLDNFVRGGDGFKPKEGSDYEAELFLDTDDDGISNKLGEFPIYDLRFTHRRTAGVIAIRSIPLDLTSQDRELRVLADSLVESISGGAYVMVQIGGEDRRTNKDRRYAAKVQRRAEATLAGQPAHVITIDVSNVDRLEVDPESVEVRATLVLVRTGAKLTFASSSKTEFPLLLIAAYINSPQDYAAAESDFVSLLSRIAVGGKAGFKLPEFAPSSTKPAADSRTRDQDPRPAGPEDPSAPRSEPETPDGGTAPPASR